MITSLLLFVSLWCLSSAASAPFQTRSIFPFVVVPAQGNRLPEQQQRSALLAVRGGADAESVKVPSKKKKKKKSKKIKKEVPVENEKAPKKKTKKTKVAKPETAPTTKKQQQVAEKVPEQEEEASKKKKKKQKLSKAAKAHMSQNIKSTSPNYRIQRELKEFLRDPPPGLTVQVGKNLRVWIVTVEGPGIYKGETFRLRIAFPPQYPVVPPSVYFLQPHLPVGPHFYTNGDICLSLLGKDWRPTMTAQSIALSILSMLASTPKKTMPMDNAAHAQNKPGQYQKDWVYHDDGC